MTKIGGYQSLEIQNFHEFHTNAIKLNTGCNSLKYILLTSKLKKIYIPYFTCDVVIETIKNLKVDYDFYTINEDFKPVFDLSKIKKDEIFLYTNYFGIMDNYIISLSNHCKNLIIDNAQSFFSLPLEKISTFYSARKFFGVPDGSYLYTTSKKKIELNRDKSYNRFQHLLKRLDLDAKAGYSDFKKNENNLAKSPIRKMSNITEILLKSIDYNKISAIRKENFYYLRDALDKKNLLNFDLNLSQIPLSYPYLDRNLALRKKLIDNNIYTPQYWPNVLELTPHNSLEYHYAKNILHLPIDQRYNVNDMDRILNVINA